MLMVRAFESQRRAPEISWAGELLANLGVYADTISGINEGLRESGFRLTY